VAIISRQIAAREARDQQRAEIGHEPGGDGQGVAERGARARHAILIRSKWCCMLAGRALPTS